MEHKLSIMNKQTTYAVFQNQQDKLTYLPSNVNRLLLDNFIIRLWETTWTTFNKNITGDFSLSRSNLALYVNWLIIHIMVDDISWANMLHGVNINHYSDRRSQFSTLIYKHFDDIIAKIPPSHIDRQPVPPIFWFASWHQCRENRQRGVCRPDRRTDFILYRSTWAVHQEPNYICITPTSTGEIYLYIHLGTPLVSLLYRCINHQSEMICITLNNDITVDFWDILFWSI